MAMKACCAKVSRIKEPKLREEDCLYVRKRRKSKRLAYFYPVHKDKSKRGGEDRISLLPDGILVAILSFLTIQEVGRSSILSRRWRYLWTFYTGKFKLDYWKMPLRPYKFVVNTILKAHRGIGVDGLIIRFPSDSSDFSDIDCWVNFASQKGVQRFELDLNPGLFTAPRANGQYKFPGIERILSGWNATSEFCSLTCLRLSDVDVTGEVVQHFLAKCRFLKQLVVERSYALKYLKVSGEELRLESLVVSQCIVKILIINAHNLVSLKFNGFPQSLLLMNAPRLSKLTIGGRICSSLNDMSCKHFSYIQQLECLTLELPPEACKEIPVSPPRLPKMYHLKHLTLELVMTYWRTLLYYTSLLEACPLLSSFTLRYLCMKSQMFPAEVDAPDFKHECLKVVELVGFRVKEADFEFAFHLLKIAISLEKLIVVPNPRFKHDSREREHASKQLAARLPTSANLEMLQN